MSRLYKITVLGLVLFSVLSVFISIPEESVYRTAADEGTYFFYATSVSKYGLSMIPEIGRVFVEREHLRLQPNPLRVGHILAISSWFKIFPQTYVSLACFSFLCFVLFLVVCFFFSRRLFGEDVAYVFTLFLSSSPLLMAMGRRALSDTHGDLFCGLAVWLFLDFLHNRKNAVYGLFLIAYSLAILARESSFVVWPFFVFGFIAWKYIYKNNVSLSYLAGIIFIPAVIVGTAYVFLFGGIKTSIDLLKTLFVTHADASRQVSRFAIMYCSGPWYRYLIDFIILSPVTILLFLAFAGHKVLVRDMDWPVAYFLGYFIMMLAFFGSLENSKEIRILINLDMVVMLFSALCLWELFRFKKSEMSVHFVLIASVSVFFVNYVNFTELFYYRDIYDPISYALLWAKKIVP